MDWIEVGFLGTRYLCMICAEQGERYHVVHRAYVNPPPGTDSHKSQIYTYSLSILYDTYQEKPGIHRISGSAVQNSRVRWLVRIRHCDVLAEGEYTYDRTEISLGFKWVVEKNWCWT